MMNTRSRRGCAACLQKHKKCDEASPTCGRCSRLRVECDYKRNLRWLNRSRLPRTRRHGPDSLRRAPHRVPPTAANVEEDQSASATPTMAGSVTPQNTQPAPVLRLDEPDNFLPAENISAVGCSPSPDPENGEVMADGICYSNQDSSDSSYSPISHFDDCNISASNIGVSDIEHHFNSSNFVQQGDGTIYGFVTDADEENSSPNEQHRDSSSLVCCDPLGSDLYSMLFEDSGSYMAYVYFVRYVSSILPGWSGVRNGYRQLAVFALSSPVLLDTIVSVSTIYMQFRGLAPGSLALRRQSRALASLRRGVDALTGGQEQHAVEEMVCLKRDVLATILLQITVEIANGTGFIQTHITHALNLFRELGYDRARPVSLVGYVLVQRMACVDVLSSIFWHRRPLLPLSFWFFNQPDDEDRFRLELDGDGGGNTTPTFLETTGCPFWVIAALARICHLVADAQEGAVPSHEIVAQAYDIEGDLAARARCNGMTGRIVDCDHRDPGRGKDEEETGNGKESNGKKEVEEARYLDIVGQCYYWSAAIILQRRVFRDPCRSRRVQFYLGRLIGLMASLPIGCGPDTQLSVPLYAAALAAQTADDRAFIKAKNVRLSEEYPMRTREALTDAFDSMWAAMDNDNYGSSSSHNDQPADGDLVPCRQLGLASDLMKERVLFIV